MRHRAIVAVLTFEVFVPLLAQGPAVDQLAWMAGCWRLESAARVIDEMWLAPSGGAMLGVSRTVSNGRAVEHEFIQIREDAGGVVFVAKPSGQAEATFSLVKSGSREVVFENPTHDFPQRISYRLEDTTLTGRIEGTQNGKLRSANFPMRKVACPS